VAGRIRTGAAGITAPNACRYTTATAGTAGLEPAASRLTSERSGRLSYAPIWSRAGGIRTHGLELMRLARTTAPLPRCWIWLARLEPASGGDVTGRGRTCDAPRFRRALYRLSYGHVNGWTAHPQHACLSSPGSEARRTCGRPGRLSRSEIVDCVANDVVHAARLPFDPGSPARRAASYVEGCWSPMLR
jgi:hypothetical protein